MSELETVSDRLRRVVAERFPSVAELPSLVWRPQPVVERGEWWSDWCLELAKFLRHDPRLLAEELRDSIESPPGVTLGTSEGYLTLACDVLPFPGSPFSSVTGNSSVSSNQTGVARRIIMCAPVPVGVSRWLAMRVAAAAAIHAHLSASSGEVSEVWLGDDRRLVCEGHCSAAQLREILSWAWESSELVPEMMNTRLEAGCREVREFGVPAAVWLMPITLPPGLFKRWHRDFVLSAETITLCCPSGGWFIDPPQHALDSRVLAAEGEQLWGLALHLAGGQSARDIDQYAGWFAEYDSLPWSARAAAERLSRTYGEAEDGLYRVQDAGGGRAALLHESFLADAVRYGTVPLFVENARRFVAEGHRAASFPPRVRSETLGGAQAEVDDERTRRLLLSACQRFFSVFGSLV